MPTPSSLRRWRAAAARGGRNLLLLLLCVALNANAFAQWAEGAAPEDAVPFDDAVQAANALIVDLDFPAAEDYLRAQMRRSGLSEEERSVLHYLLSLALVGQEKYEEAEKILRALLVENPAATNVRLSLGRVLFRRGNDAAAERQLDLVLADETAPDYVHQQAHLHLAQIRARNGWVPDFSFKLTRTSNVNNAPPSDAVIYVNILGGRLPFTPSEQEEYAWVGSWSASAAYRQQMSARTQVEGRIALYGNIAAGDWDSSTGVQLSIGPRFLFPRAILGISAVAGQHFAPDPTSRSVGLSGFAQYALPRGWRPYASAQYLQQNHLHDDELSGASKYLQTGVRFGLDQVTNGNIAFTYTRNSANGRRNSYKTWRFNTDFQRDFPGGWTFGTGLSYSRSEFDAGISSLIPTPERFSQTEFNISVLKRDFAVDFAGFGWGYSRQFPPGVIFQLAPPFVPKLVLSRVNKSSNIDLKDFSTDSVALEFTANF